MCESTLKDILPLTYAVAALDDLKTEVIEARIRQQWPSASGLATLTQVLQNAHRPQIGDRIIVSADNGSDEPIHRRLNAVVVGPLKLIDLGVS